ncbi:MAG: glycosyltransferase family 4 protein [Candidatus Kapabacteria bacterium]|jgi:glycosyltransferase involved in cell wall biosynthesis|nr:glycosyltransferase family 4 protein [Candidatus Kapabacteria bacterium]
MKKILYIWKGAYPWDVRAEKVCTALIKAGHEVYMLARWTGEELERETVDGINVIRVGYKRKPIDSLPLSLNPMWRKAIRSAIIETKPDLLIAREIMLARASGKIAHKFKLPMIIDMAEHYPAAMRGWEKYTKTFLRRLVTCYVKVPDRVEKSAVKVADGIMIVSPELTTRINREYGYPVDKIQVINNTPEKAWFEGVRIGCSNPVKEFAYHGFMTPDRNLDMMVRGFILAAEQDPDIRLTISGDGETFALCNDLATKSKVSDRIIFTGSYKHSEIKKLYGDTDIGFLPFKNNEFINHIIANKLFDYMAAGKPIIVSQADPMVRLIEETGAGIIADCNDPEKIAEAIINIRNADTETMSANGIKSFREKYNWDYDAAKVNEFINKYL